MNMLAFGTPGPSEWMLILIIVLVLFGAKRLPELARSLGQSMNEFRKAREEFDRELQQAANDVKTPPAQPQRTVTPVVQAPQVQAPVQGTPQVQPAPGTQPVQQPEPPQTAAGTAGTPQASDPGRPIAG